MSSENFNREDVCLGCFTYTTEKELKNLVERTRYGTVEGLQCGIEPIINGTKCPCSICLVKMMCDITCEKIDKYMKDYSSKLGRPLPK
jgi:hypothetical protein